MKHEIVPLATFVDINGKEDIIDIKEMATVQKILSHADYQGRTGKSTVLSRMVLALL